MNTSPKLNDKTATRLDKTWLHPATGMTVGWEETANGQTHYWSPTGLYVGAKEAPAKKPAQPENPAPPKPGKK